MRRCAGESRGEEVALNFQEEIEGVVINVQDEPRPLGAVGSGDW
jgi:hypothetical protein